MKEEVNGGGGYSRLIVKHVIRELSYKLLIETYKA